MIRVIEVLIVSIISLILVGCDSSNLTVHCEMNKISHLTSYTWKVNGNIMSTVGKKKNGKIENATWDVEKKEIGGYTVYINQATGSVLLSLSNGQYAPIKHDGSIDHGFLEKIKYCEVT